MGAVVIYRLSNFPGDARDGGDAVSDIYRFTRHARHHRHLFYKCGRSIRNVIAALPERRFCVPAPESHRSVAALISSRGHIPVRTVIQLSRSKVPSSYLDKG